MRLVPFVVAILLWASSLGLAAAGRDAADTDAPPWFSAPAEIVGCKAERPPDTRDLVQRYACGDAWVDVFIYDPARLGVTLKPGESTVEAEFRVFLDETAHDLVAQAPMLERLVDLLAFTLRRDELGDERLHAALGDLVTLVAGGHLGLGEDLLEKRASFEGLRSAAGLGFGRH